MKDYGQQHYPTIKGTGGAEHSRLRCRPLPTNYEQPTGGNLSGGVAECSYIRGATHKRTDSAGTSHGETLSESNHPSPGGRLIGGQTKQPTGTVFPCW